MKTQKRITARAASLALLAFATGGTALHAAETPRVLPKGISRVRFVGIFTQDIVDKYNSEGKLEPMTSSLNKTLTVRDFARKEPKLNQLASALNALQAGLGEQLLGANLYSDFTTTQSQYLLAYERGITDRLSLGIRAPIVKNSVKARFSAVGVNNGAHLAAQMGSLSPALTQGLFDLGGKQFNTAFFEQSLFTSKGYEAPHDFEKSGIGDTELGAKYAFLQGRTFYVSGLLGGKIPTGSAPSMTNIFDKGTGTGAWGMAAQGTTELTATHWLTYGAAQKLTYYVPDTRARAVPRDPDDSLPSLKPEDGQVQEVTRTQSPVSESEINTQVKLMNEMITTWAAYQYLMRGEDSYSGGGSNLDYASMSKNSAISSGRVELGIGFSTIPLYRRKVMPIPMEIQGLYNTGLTGKNTPLASYSRVDLIMYF
jgi:hypothetical protein